MAKGHSCVPVSLLKSTKQYAQTAKPIYNNIAKSKSEIFFYANYAMFNNLEKKKRVFIWAFEAKKEEEANINFLFHLFNLSRYWTKK